MVTWREHDNSKPQKAGARAESDPFRQVWHGMMAYLKAQHAPIRRAWFDELVPLGIESGALEVRTLSDVHRDYLRKQCADAFNDAARTASGRLISVRFLGPADPAASLPGSTLPLEAPARPVVVEPPEAATVLEPKGPLEPPVTAPARRSALSFHEAPSRYDRLVINPDFSFENFVVGPNNRLAHAAALGVAANPGRNYNPYFVHGGVGLGKTHLLQAIHLKIMEANPGANIYYTSCDNFINQFFESVQSGEMAQFRHRFRDADVLIIDDIHCLTRRDRSQEEFFHTFNSLYQANKQIILSSDAAPEEIPSLEDRLVSRFKWGLVAKIEAPDYETRIQIVKTKSRLRGVDVPSDVAEFVAGSIDRNIRELEGAIVKLQVQSTVDRAPITMDLARRALGELVRPPAEYVPTLHDIITVVCDFYNIRLSDLQSKHRQRSIALPRHVCMYLARRCTRHSLEEVGGTFGGRDHTTVMHAIRTVEAKIVSDPEFASVMRLLEERAKKPPANP
ncbi:MAG: chromosomal replication initiator protein DnaA [Phycisphaerales bacterium]